MTILETEITDPRVQRDRAYSTARAAAEKVEAAKLSAKFGHCDPTTCKLHDDALTKAQAEHARLRSKHYALHAAQLATANQDEYRTLAHEIADARVDLDFADRALARVHDVAHEAEREAERGRLIAHAQAASLPVFRARTQKLTATLLAQLAAVCATLDEITTVASTSEAERSQARRLPDAAKHVTLPEGSYVDHVRAEIAVMLFDIERTEAARLTNVQSWLWRASGDIELAKRVADLVGTNFVDDRALPVRQQIDLMLAGTYACTLRELQEQRAEAGRIATAERARLKAEQEAAEAEEMKMRGQTRDRP